MLKIVVPGIHRLVIAVISRKVENYTISFKDKKMIYNLIHKKPVV